MITPERWQRIQALCEVLETIDPADQAAVLGDLEPDESVRAETASILQAMRDEASFGKIRRSAHASEELPQVIAGIRILGRIAAGGSGEVFRGVRTVNGADQLVAVKRFHAHRAGPEHLERFAREQQMLAALTHPDIVRFLDGGVTADGRPYLVMELAEGQPLTEYCDSRRSKLSERLGLFISVCEAVQSAHRHLIVHLDLKPSNILVTHEGRVKLLDFGAAKLVEPDAFTRTEPLTLLYASPERLRGEPVTVACDVYSLGLILFELIAGAWPFPQTASIVAMAERASGRADMLSPLKVITAHAAEHRNTTVDRLASAVRGDLEAIVSKALAHDPADRYPSVSELAEDLRRFLAGEAVRARTPGVGYRVGKFLRRHAWEATAIVVLIVALAAAAIYSMAQARAAQLAARRAETQHRFLASVFTLAGNDGASRHDMTVRELLQLAQERIEPSLAADPAIAGDVELTLAQGYLLQSAHAEARALLERTIARSVAAGDVVREAAARAHLAYVAYVQSRTGEAVDTALQALSLWEAHPSRFAPAQAVQTLRLAASTLMFAETTDPRHRRYFEACLDIARAAPSEVPTVEHANCLYGLGASLANLDARYAEAHALLRQALDLHRQGGTTSQVSSTLQMLGLVNRYRGAFTEDERAQREAYELVARLQGPASLAAVWQKAVWIASLPGVGRIDEAYRESQEVLAFARQEYPTRGSYLLWTPLYSASYAACMARRFDECEALALEAIESLGPSPAPGDPRLHTARGFLGLALSQRDRCVDAQPLLEGALAMQSARKRVTPYGPMLEQARTSCARASR